MNESTDTQTEPPSDVDEARAFLVKYNLFSTNKTHIHYLSTGLYLTSVVAAVAAVISLVVGLAGANLPVIFLVTAIVVGAPSYAVNRLHQASSNAVTGLLEADRSAAQDKADLADATATLVRLKPEALAQTEI